MKTTQEIFDIVSEHLLTQNAKAGVTRELCPDEIDRGPASQFVCQYHAPDGKRCAVGCLIPPEIDTSSFNSAGVLDAMDTAPEVFTSLGLCASGLFSLLARLQRCHDNDEPEEWPESLMRLAKQYDLRPSLALLKAYDLRQEQGTP